MPGSQTDSPSSKKQYGKDTLRPVTIKQLADAQHPNPDAEFFEIDGTEASQVTFVGQIRNISKQVTNITYRLDDGTGTFEVKVWIDDSANDENDAPGRKGLVENAYARVWGKLKTFGKRHVVAHVIRPVQDMNEVNFHLLEATYVHLYFQRGALGDKNGGGAMNGQQQDEGYGGGAAPAGQLPATASSASRKLYECILNTPQTNEGLHLQDIAMRTNLEENDVLKAADELIGLGKIYTTVDDHTWGLLDM